MKRTRHLSGAAKSAYLRRLIERVRRGSRATGHHALEAVLAQADAEIVRMWVRASDHDLQTSGRTSARAPTCQETASPPVSAAAPASPAPAPFDPYAFSAMAVLLSDGRGALERLLEPISEPQHMQALAQAQSVSIDAALATASDIEALKVAFIAAVEQRIAHRRAITRPATE